MADTDNWYDDYDDQNEEQDIDEYDITATPNDFNILTLYSFIESGAVRIPGFQRNFVWDQVRASKLIESLVLGLPVPQIFLYEQARNEFLVIDGQQRLMSVYYFIKKRFPRKEKRVELRKIFDENNQIPERVLSDDQYFVDFKLKLSAKLPNRSNKFSGLNYSTLGDYKVQFDLRPIRNIVVKQNSPAGDDSSIFEVFNRLNTGGINLRPQEIRSSLYHSKFYEMLYRINLHDGWRKIIQSSEPDIHTKDIEILLRGFAMLIKADQYAPSLVKFLNQFSRFSQRFSDSENEYMEGLFESFVVACDDLPEDAFINRRNKRFNIALYEAVFSAACGAAYGKKKKIRKKLDLKSVRALELDDQFVHAALEGTTSKLNVSTRIARAKKLIKLR